VLTLELKRKVVGQVPALMISAEEEERVWVPNLESPQIEYTLRARVPEMSKRVRKTAGNDALRC
jgi:hypothetical protein